MDSQPQSDQEQSLSQIINNMQSIDQEIQQRLSGNAVSQYRDPVLNDETSPSDPDLETSELNQEISLSNQKASSGTARLNQAAASEGASSNRLLLSSPDFSMFMSDIGSNGTEQYLPHCSPLFEGNGDPHHVCPVLLEKYRLIAEIYKEAMSISTLLMQHLVDRPPQQ